MSTNEALEQYRQSVADARQYAADAFLQNSDGTYLYDESHQNFIVDAAILKFFIAWETYLESIFKCYILGENTTLGTSVHTCVIARDEMHANALLIGMNKYFDWANQELVCKLSKLYFDNNNPIVSAINQISNDLRDLRTIRNSVAHITQTTQTQIEALAQRITGRMQTGITPSKLMFLQESNTGLDYWDYYQQKLDIAAENIAKGIVI